MFAQIDEVKIYKKKLLKLLFNNTVQKFEKFSLIESGFDGCLKELLIVF